MLGNAMHGSHAVATIRACTIDVAMVVTAVGRRAATKASTSLDLDARRAGIIGRYRYQAWPWAVRSLKRMLKSPYRALLLAVLGLTMFFMSAAVRRTLYPLDGVAGARGRVRADPCSASLLEESWGDDEGRRGLSDGKPLPQGGSLLERLELGNHSSIGVVNMDFQEALDWQVCAQGRLLVRIPLTPVNQSLQWSDFYPEWIDERKLYMTPKCPPVALPCAPKGIKLDLVIARVPCSNGERDIHRLQALLSAASVASQAGEEEMNVLVISECRPALNVFPCRELLEHDENAWLYRVNLSNMRSRLALPVGSCELSLSVEYPGGLAVKTSNERARQAYVSMVHTDASYVCGAIVLAHSIRLSGSTRDLVMLVDKSILPEQRQGLEEAGWKVREVERIRNPYAKPNSYNEWNYSKFRLWQLTEYAKIVFIDSDLLVLRNMDFLFQLPELSATGNDVNRFNSGVMVIEPSNCTFNILLNQIMVTRSYNGGDQGYLNEIFPLWYRVPKKLNYLKVNDTEAIEKLFAANPPALYGVHYLGIKPWLCFRDYDCNWNREDQQPYANDLAHSMWFKVHDSMGLGLQRHCWLSTLIKASLEVDRRRAEAANLDDGHWKIKIKDPRLEHCLTPGHCDWEVMVRHWS